MLDKKDLYQRIKIAGILSFIPFVLAAGALAGYLAGEFLDKKFHFGPLLLGGCIILGLIVSGIEAIRIIRLALKIEKED